jgi:hypothetical protein
MATCSSKASTSLQSPVQLSAPDVATLQHIDEHDRDSHGPVAVPDLSAKVIPSVLLRGHVDPAQPKKREGNFVGEPDDPVHFLTDQSKWQHCDRRSLDR